MSGLSLTSSVVVARALQLPLEGVKAKEEGVCAFCGLHVGVGDLSAPFAPGANFMDDLSLEARGSKVVCAYCAAVMTAEALRATGYGVFSEEGVLPFRKWADIAAALRNPPTSPFVMTYATANNQHMAWRAPVNYSPDLFYVRVGLRDLKIRHRMLLDAVDACERVELAFGGKATDRTRAHPFQTLSADLKDESHGKLRVFSPRYGQSPEEHAAVLAANEQDIRLLLGLTLGETWALRFLLDTGAALRDAAAATAS
jgi:CRISPR type IV-associated protein Csf1